MQGKDDERKTDINDNLGGNCFSGLGRGRQCRAIAGAFNYWLVCCSGGSNNRSGQAKKITSVLRILFSNATDEMSFTLGLVELFRFS